MAIDGECWRAMPTLQDPDPAATGFDAAMWNGIYQRWAPLPQFEGRRLYCDAIHHDYEGFRIWLRDEDPSRSPLIVRFEMPLLYLHSNESFRIARIEPRQELQFPHAFWKVADSELVEVFHRQSCDAYRTWAISHFAFIACDDCVDVLAVAEPSILES